MPVDEREWTRNAEVTASPQTSDTHGDVREPSEDTEPARAESGASSEDEAGYGHGV